MSNGVGAVLCQSLNKFYTLGISELRKRKIIWETIYPCFRANCDIGDDFFVFNVTKQNTWFPVLPGMEQRRRFSVIFVLSHSKPEFHSRFTCLDKISRFEFVNNEFHSTYSKSIILLCGALQKNGTNFMVNLIQ